MSSLPFLSRKRKEVGVIVQERAHDSDKSDTPSGMTSEALKAAAQDILRAINSNDSEHLALAIKAAFDICDSEPHEEGPHTNEDESQE